MEWFIFALLSAVFAALVSILAKLGLKDINSDLATAIRTTVVLVFTWGIAFFRGATKNFHELNKKTIIFLVLSGIATGISWLFYFRALQMGKASKVAPIDKLSTVITVIFAVLILKEELSLTAAIGVVLVGVGTVLLVLN